MACGGFTCSKNALAALNVLYVLVAFMLIGFASWGKYIAVITSIKVLGGIVACGVFLLFVALIGLVGAIKHHQVMLFFYMVILFLIFLVQFILACVCLAVNHEQQQNLARTGWDKARDDTRLKVQTKFQCCGFYKAEQGEVRNESLVHPPCVNSSRDICENAPTHTLCCYGPGNKTSDNNGTDDTCPMPACWDALDPVMDGALKTSGGIGLFFSFTEILGVWLAMRYRNQKDPKANPSAFL